jgi:predicted RNA-binding Zn ribbon-like protein
VDTSPSAAPGRLAIIQELANSFERTRGRDDLVDLDAAVRWLRHHGLLPTGTALSREDLSALHRLREAIRGLCLANNGCERRPADLQALNQVALSAGLGPGFRPDGAVELTVRADGGLGVCGRLVAIVCEAIWNDTWRRLKACPGDACNYAFYDHSRNGSRSWCAMARCGSRNKMRAYRLRRRTSSARQPPA